MVRKRENLLFYQRSPLVDQLAGAPGYPGWSTEFP